MIGVYSSEDLVARAVVVVGVWCLSGDVEGEVVLDDVRLRRSLSRFMGARG